MKLNNELLDLRLDNLPGRQVVLGCVDVVGTLRTDTLPVSQLSANYSQY